MKLPVLLSTLCFLFSLCGPVLAGDRGAGIFYFDEDFSIRFGMIAAVEEAARTTDRLTIESVDTEKTYTNGRRFIVQNPRDLTLEELNATTDYAKIGETDILLSGKSFLSSSAGFPPWLEDMLADSFSRYSARKVRADLVRGVTPWGREFVSVELRGRRPNRFWSYTLNMNYDLSTPDGPMKVTESSFPLGLSGFSRYVRASAAHKSSNTLISMGLANEFTLSVDRPPLADIVRHLSDFNTDMAALRPDDLPYLWNETKKDGAALSAGGIAFVCSNIEVKDARLAGLIKPYFIRELNGVKTAFVSFIPSNSEQLADLRNVPVAVNDPAAFASSGGVLKELKKDLKVKLVVAVAPSRKDLGALLGDSGIDIIIGPKGWEKPGSRYEQFEFDDWDNDDHDAPAALLFRDSRGVGEISLVFSENGSLKSLRARSVPLYGDDLLYSLEYGDLKEKLAQYFFGAEDTLLPDRRNLFPKETAPKALYSPLEFHNILASAMKRETGAEIAFVKIRPPGGTMLGEVSVSMVKTWLGRDDDLVKAWVPGSLIKALTPKFELDRTAGEDSAKYRDRAYFAVAGMDQKGNISGLPVRNSELYLAAFPEKFLQEKDEYPQLKHVRIAGKAGKPLNTLVLEDLERTKKSSAGSGTWEAAVRKLVENRPKTGSVWRLNVRDLSLQANDTRVRNTDSFSQVSDSRLRTVRQTLIQGSGKVFSEFYKGDLRLDAGVSADYGKLTLRPRDEPRVQTESVDQIVIESEFRYKLLRYENLLGSMLLGPFFNLSYDTEFTHQPELPKRKIVRGRAGMKLFEGAYLREFYAGLVTEQNYTNSPARTNYAAEAGFGADMVLPGTALRLIADGNYRNYADSRFDTAADLKQRLELNFRLSTKLYGDVMISPFFNFFLATGKVSRATAVNVMTGVSLNYSRLFKLKY